jgi:hypothetical protein
VALRYGMPVVAVAVATLITTSSLMRFGQTPPFWLAILVKGLFGGRGPALLAVLLSIPAGTVVFVHPPQLLAGVYSGCVNYRLALRSAARSHGGALG